MFLCLQCNVQIECKDKILIFNQSWSQVNTDLGGKKIKAFPSWPLNSPRALTFYSSFNEPLFFSSRGTFQNHS